MKRNRFGFKIPNNKLSQITVEKETSHYCGNICPAGQ